jgi:hypothetical protein
MAEGNFRCELIEAKRVNLLNIILYDLQENKSYKAKCVCGHVFNIDIYISGLFLEEQKKSISPYVTRKSGGHFDLSGTIHKTLGIHFDKHDAYVNVSWVCAKCVETITLVVKIFF